MDKAFEVMTIAKKKYLIFPNGQSVHVVSEDGENLGSFYSKDSFVKFYKNGNALPLGKAAIGIQRTF